MADTRPNVLFVLTDQERYDCHVPESSVDKEPEPRRNGGDGSPLETGSPLRARGHAD